MKYTAKRLKNDDWYDYEYRGYKITREESTPSGYYGAWTTTCPNVAGSFLKDCKKKIDAKIESKLCK